MAFLLRRFLVHPAIFAAVLMFQGSSLFAQPGLSLFNEQRQRINGTGMIILGSWGVINVITGAVGLTNSNGSAKHFHRMNCYFGAVNTALSAAGLLGLRKTEAGMDACGTLKKQLSIEKLFLFNMALDIAYVAGGVYLMERGNRIHNRDQNKGYGKSVVLQGVTLLVFDGLMYRAHAHHRQQLFPVLENLHFTGTGLTVVFHL